NAFLARGGKDCRGTFRPARVCQHRACLSDFCEGQPSRIGWLFRAAEVDDLAFPPGVDDDPGNGRAGARKEPEVGDVHLPLFQVTPHQMTMSVVAGSSPELHASTEPGSRDGCCRSHAAADGPEIGCTHLAAA